MMRQLKLFGYIGVAIAMLAGGGVSSVQAAELRNLPETVKFTLGAGAGESHGFIIEALGGRMIECKAFAGKGEFTSERLGLAEFGFKECAAPSLGVKCTGLADTTAGNITVKAEFHTRHLLPNSEGVNVAMLAGTVHFSCGISLFSALGCGATMDLLTESGNSIVNALIAIVKLDLLQEKGDQKPTSIDTDNSLGMEACVLLLKEGAGAFESAGLLDAGVIEKFENGKGEPVTELVDLSGTL